MRVLLVGEYSGLFNCLKDGLIAHGHSVFLASDGDGYRNYPSDFRWDKCFKLKHLSSLFVYWNIIKNRKLFVGYDVVMFVSTRVFMSKASSLPNLLFYKYILKHNKKSFICDSGLDFLGIRYWFEKKKSKYYNYVLGYCNPSTLKSELLNRTAEKRETQIRNLVDGCIPIWYEYAEPYRHFKNLKKAIRIPIDVNKFSYKPNVVNGKILFFHGLTRACKGGKYIQDAFERMQKKHGEIAEFVCAGGLPFDEYMKITSRANVILDDVNSYSFSMNALFAMSRGIIYMGGAEPEGNNELGYKECPVINLTRDVDQICSAIEYIINNKERIEEMGLASRRFVEKYHSHYEIAQEYVNCWNNTI